MYFNNYFNYLIITIILTVCVKYQEKNDEMSFRMQKLSYKMTAKILTRTRCIISVAQFLSFTSAIHSNGTHINRQGSYITWHCSAVVGQRAAHQGYRLPKEHL